MATGWIQDKKVTVMADIQFQPEHFNPRCNATIPEAWQVEATNIDELTRPLGDFDHYQLYSFGNTKDEAILNFRALVMGMFPQGGVIKFH